MLLSRIPLEVRVATELEVSCEPWRLAVADILKSTVKPVLIRYDPITLYSQQLWLPGPIPSRVRVLYYDEKYYLQAGHAKPRQPACRCYLNA